MPEAKPHLPVLAQIAVVVLPTVVTWFSYVMYSGLEEIKNDVKLIKEQTIINREKVQEHDKQLDKVNNKLFPSAYFSQPAKHEPIYQFEPHEEIL